MYHRIAAEYGFSVGVTSHGERLCQVLFIQRFDHLFPFYSLVMSCLEVIVPVVCVVLAPRAFLV